MNKQKIIFTGGSGMLAVNWAFNIRSDYEVLLLTHNHLVTLDGVLSRQVSLTDGKHIRNVISDFNADWLIHTAGLTNVDICENEPDKAYDVNVGITENVANACKDTGCSLVHISTDHLFDGSKPLVSENEPVNPVNIYGKTKAQAEDKVTTIIPESLIIRTNFYGWGHKYRQSLSDWIINLLESGQQVPAFYDSWFTPIFFNQLIDAIHGLMKMKSTGIFNICGDNRISKYDFARSIAENFEYDTKLIQKTSINDADLFAKRPKDMSLSNEKICKFLDKKIGEFDKGITALLNNRSHQEKIREAVTC